jgi:hypothetical protein
MIPLFIGASDWFAQDGFVTDAGRKMFSAGFEVE